MAIKRNRKRNAGASIEKLSSLLERIDPDCNYDSWMRALMVIYYETADSDEGFELANAWSSKGYKYRGRNDVRSTWKYFDPSHPTPVGLPTLIRMAKG